MAEILTVLSFILKVLLYLLGIGFTGFIVLVIFGLIINTYDKGIKTEQGKKQ